jgi:hypothetical protein
VVRVQPDAFPITGRQWSCYLADSGRDRDASQVVNQGCPAQFPQLGSVQPAQASGGDGQLRDPGVVAAGRPEAALASG